MRCSLPERVEGARREVLARLSVSDYPDLLHLFYVDDQEDMANLTGNPVTGYSYFNDHVAVVVFNKSWRAFEDWLSSRYAPIPDVALEAVRRGGCGVGATSAG